MLVWPLGRQDFWMGQGAKLVVGVRARETTGLDRQLAGGLAAGIGCWV